MTVTLNGKLNRLLADTRFETLKRSKLTINSFHLNHSREMDHSSMLAWLLNPDEGHGLGDRFVRRLLIECFRWKHANSGDQARIEDLTLSTVHGYSFGQAVVITELVIDSGRIDILVVDPMSEVVIAIENKYGAGESGQQLKNYKKWVNANFQTYNKVYVFLDAFGGEKNVEPWISLDYSWITDFLEEVTKFEDVHVRVKTILTDYLKYIKDEYFDEWNKYDRDMLVALYHSHKEIFEDKDIRKLLRDIVDGDWHWQSLDELFSDQKYQMEKWVIYRNIEIFEDLLNVHHLEHIELELERQDKGCEVELGKSYLNYLPSTWKKSVTSTGKWTAFCRLKVVDEMCKLSVHILYRNLDEVSRNNQANDFVSGLGVKKYREAAKTSSQPIASDLPLSDLREVVSVVVDYGRRAADSSVNT